MFALVVYYKQLTPIKMMDLIGFWPSEELAEGFTERTEGGRHKPAPTTKNRWGVFCSLEATHLERVFERRAERADLERAPGAPDRHDGEVERWGKTAVQS